MSLNRTILFLSFMSLGLTACATAGRGFNENRYDEIREGVTTKAQLQSMLGEPNSSLRSTADSSGCGVESWIYTRAYVIAVVGGHAKELNVKLDQRGIVCGKSLKETRL